MGRAGKALGFYRMFKDIQAVKTALLGRSGEGRILVVGDLIVDRYLWGSATRISPEAPVPVVRVERRTVVLGGAANVAANLASLGAPVDLAGYVGQDGDAQILLDAAAQAGIGTDAVVALPRFPTIVKSRVIADDRQVLRFDDERAVPLTVSESDQIVARVQALLDGDSYTALIISDYAKGVCTPELCQAVIVLCRERGIPVIVDPKGRDYGKYGGATAIKPNRVEIIELAQAMGWPADDPVDCAVRLRDYLDLDFVALTLGAHGIAVVQRDGLHEIPTVAREVFDVSGAGDTVIATLVFAMATGIGIEDGVALANLAAAQVIARTGTSTIGRDELLLAVQDKERNRSVRKLYSIDELTTLVHAWKAQGLRVAVTNGCFDLIHAGHVRLLEDSAAETDRLIVAINSDASITRLKGEARPIMPVEARSVVLSALECIDALVVFEEDTPLAVIEAVRPDMLIKGGDYTVETVVGSDLVLSYGGEVRLVPLVPGYSTTRLAEAIGKL